MCIVVYYDAHHRSIVDRFLVKVTDSRVRVVDSQPARDTTLRNTERRVNRIFKVNFSENYR